MQQPAWFDEVHYGKQKAAQMNAIGWRDTTGNAKTDWTAEDWPAELARFNAENHTSFTPYDNFLACNAANYETGIELGAINVSPNPLFDVPIYLTNLAACYNDSGFAAPGHAAGAWTAETALSYLFEVEHVSAWEHFKTAGLELQLNPSNEFDTGAYLLARASVMGSGATVADAIAAIADSGLNPLEDFFLWGQPRQIQAQAVASPVTPELGLDDVWHRDASEPDAKPDKPSSGGQASPDAPATDSSGGSSNGDNSSSGSTPSAPADPPSAPLPTLEPLEKNEQYDANTVTQEIAADAPAIGQTGQNTLFTASYAGPTGSVAPDSVISGGADANNSLVLDLGANWPGFGAHIVNGQATPNVTNVGRVVINHDSGDPTAALEFNAANIQGLEQLEINDSGSGAISAANLPESAKFISIKNIAAAASDDVPATTLAYDKAPQQAQISLEKVCSDGENAAAININGVAQLELASSGTGNSIDLAHSQGIRKIVVMAGAPLAIADCDGSTIEEYDASRTAGSVNFGVSGFVDGAVVKGGTGAEDTLTFNDFVTVDAAKWSGVENIVFNAGGAINAEAASGIESLWKMGSEPITVNNITSQSLTVYDAGESSLARASMSQPSSVTGVIGDVTYRSCGMKERPATIDANFASNATNDCLITTEGGDKLGVTSVFELPELTGTITINDPNPTSRDSYASPIIDGIKLQAEQATGLNITHTGSMRICGALWSVRDIQAELTACSAASNYYDLFKLPELPSASNINIAADNTEIYITALGYETNTRDMDLNIANASDVYIGGLYGAGDITGVIDSDFTEIKEIHTKGDIDLAVSGKYLEIEENGFGVNDGFIGAAVNIDFSNLKGSVGSTVMIDGDTVYGMMLDVEALGGSLTYKGAAGSDNLLVGGLTGGTHSQVQTGAGNDEVVIQTLDSIGAGQLATLDVDLGAGSNILRVYNMNQTGNLIVNVAGAENHMTAIYKECGSSANITNVAAANLALAAIDAGFELDDSVRINKGVFEYGGNAYWLAAKFNDGQAHGVTLIAAEGCTADMIMDDDL